MSRIGWQEKWTLRFAIAGLVFLALAGLEGILMRTQLVSLESLRGMESVLMNIRPVAYEPSSTELFYAMLTAHPVVGIYGFAYMCVMGAFYFLVPFLLKKEIRYKNLVPVNFTLQIVGVLTCWAAGFFGLFNSLYTLYWPLPVAYDRVPVVGSVVFAAGLVLIEINVLIFAFNLFSTVLRKSNPQQYSFWQFLASAFGIPRLVRWLSRRKLNDPEPMYSKLPVFIVAVGRGSIDTVINAVVILSAGVLILIYGLPALLTGLSLNPSAVDALVYKNWFWWGLDMVADGNVLMYTAGVWYLLIPLLVNRKLYGENVVRTVILADLVVSMFVWSHHLLADRPQPFFMRLLSGQFITWGEFFTMGLTIFASMMTIWLARPVKFSPALKFVLGSIFGFAIGGMAGLMQANIGLNVVLHNTQWVIGSHAHTMLLIGLGMLLFAVIYALIPMLTGLEIRSQKAVNYHLWFWLIGALVMSEAMGKAGSEGMLRRTLYTTTQYQPHMVVALIGASLMAVGFVVFLVNIVATLGWRNVLSVILPERKETSSFPVQSGEQPLQPSVPDAVGYIE
ncbi:MAG: cbb3-type cytochrome c oxidase subunit I [Actinobacteria bacterium]|nr:cbb3-type cytochrome c oxidase subunit I [Actinomycetota bacterium]